MTHERNILKAEKAAKEEFQVFTFFCDPTVYG